MLIELTPGPRDSPVVEEGHLFEGAPAFSLSDLRGGDAMGVVGDLVVSIKGITDILRRNESAARIALAAPDATARIAASIARLEQTVNAAADATEKLLRKLEGNLTSGSEDLASSLASFRRASADAEKVAAGLREIFETRQRPHEPRLLTNHTYTYTLYSSQTYHADSGGPQMIERITIIEPRSDRLHIFSRFELPRLGAVLLATIMRDRGYEAQALYMSTRDILARTPTADLVGISTITATAPSAYSIGDAFRARGIPVVFGGPHVTFMPEEALAHGDYCITGEGETGFPLLVEALNGKRSLSEVPGLVWRENGALRRNPPAAPIEDLDSLPFPDFSLLVMGGRARMGGPGPGRATIPIQTSRGCPFDCSFCSVTGMFGRRYRHRSTANIIAELSRYNPREKIIFFYDDNFTANRAKTKELLREMIRLELGFEWSTQVRADVANDPELLDLMGRAGCSALYIGFESVDPQALKEMRKSQTVEEIRWAVRQIRRAKIHIHGMFVFGFDSDTPEKTRATVRFAMKEKIDSAQFLILTPLPGSDFYTQMQAEGRLLDTAWDTYDAHHVKFRPVGFSPWELQLAQIRAHARFYSPLQILRRLLRGRVASFVIAVYAHSISKRWLREERGYLRLLRAGQRMLRSTPRGALASS